MLILLALLGCAPSVMPSNNVVDTGSVPSDTGTDTGTADDSDNDTGSDTATDSGTDSADSGADTDTGAADTDTTDTGGTDSGSDTGAADTDTGVADTDTGTADTDSGGTDSGSDTGTVDTGVDCGTYVSSCDGTVVSWCEGSTVLTYDCADAGSYECSDASGTAECVYVETDADLDGVTVEEGDCDDADATVYPGAPEIADDGTDQDCDGVDQVTSEADVDGDGYGVSEDCDDTNPSVNPGAVETCNGIDDDCDASIDEGLTGTWYADTDGDAFGDADTFVTGACSAASGYVADSSDCDDSEIDVHPGAAEIPDDGIDQDCDGSDATMAELQDVAVCSSGQEACFRDVDGDGSYETLLMDEAQIYGMPATAEVYENGSGTGCGLSGDSVGSNAAGYYVVSFDGLSSCTSQVSVVSTSGSSTYWWQNYTFCTDGSDSQGICVATGTYDYLIEIDYRSSTGLRF